MHVRKCVNSRHLTVSQCIYGYVTITLHFDGPHNLTENWLFLSTVMIAIDCANGVEVMHEHYGRLTIIVFELLILKAPELGT
jgi:hypothetical protein